MSEEYLVIFWMFNGICNVAEAVGSVQFSD